MFDDKEISMNIPVKLEGSAPGVIISGGVLSRNKRKLRVKALPANLPDFITVKEEYWEKSKQEDIWQHIKDGYDADGWNIEKYKLIPRRREYEDGVEVIIAEISPNITFTDKDEVEQEVKEIVIHNGIIIRVG